MEIRRTPEFGKWLRRQKDHVIKERILTRINRASVTGQFGDAKSVGEGVLEMRIDAGGGIRLYYAYRGKNVVLLLIGGDKSSQRRDIAKAIKLNQRYE